VYNHDIGQSTECGQSLGGVWVCRRQAGVIGRVKRIISSSFSLSRR